MADTTPSDKTIMDFSDLCTQVGFCLAQFSKTEESLAALYGVAAGVARMEIAFRTHDAIREFQYRLGATDAVVRYWLEIYPDQSTREEAETEWNALYRVIKEDSQDRNRLAHFTIGSEVNSDDTITYYVCPYFQLFSKNPDALEAGIIPAGTRKFDIKSMRSKMDRFVRNTKRIDSFIGRLTALGAPLPKWSSRQADDSDEGTPPE